jgi:hypothetical protein
MQACALGTTNCDVWDTSSIDPFALGWPLRFHADGETKNQQSDVPGTASSHTPYTVIKGRDNGGAWYNATWGSASASIARYHASWITQDKTMHIWTA